MAIYSFTYPSVINSEEKMLNDLAIILIENKIHNPEKHEFMLVISEAFTNALLHGNQLNPNKNIYLHIEINKNILSADVIDEGELGVIQIQEKKPSALYDENGRGVDFMRHFCNQVTFTEAENGGTKVSIYKKREVENII